MLKQIKPLFLLAALFLSSCMSSPGIGFINNAGATVSNGNFEYLGKVYGEASSGRILLFFRIEQGDLYQKAMQDLTNNADLYNGRNKKALINITMDNRIEGRFIFTPIYCKEIVKISADLIEYIDDSHYCILFGRETCTSRLFAGL